MLVGLAPFVAAGPISRPLGFPANHDTPTARLMARLLALCGGAGWMTVFLLLG
jgi:hypothetical protein